MTMTWGALEEQYAFSFINLLSSMFALAGAWFPPARHTYGLPPELPTKDTGT
jgi:hypothetical protein